MVSVDHTYNVITKHVPMCVSIIQHNLLAYKHHYKLIVHYVSVKTCIHKKMALIIIF